MKFYLFVAGACFWWRTILYRPMKLGGRLTRKPAWRNLKTWSWSNYARTHFEIINLWFISTNTCQWKQMYFVYSFDSPSSSNYWITIDGIKNTNLASWKWISNLLPNPSRDLTNHWLYEIDLWSKREHHQSNRYTSNWK